MRKNVRTSAADDMAENLRDETQENNKLKQKGGNMEEKNKDVRRTFLRIVFVFGVIWLGFIMFMVNPAATLEFVSKVATIADAINLCVKFIC